MHRCLICPDPFYVAYEDRYQHVFSWHPIIAACFASENADISVLFDAQEWN